MAWVTLVGLSLLFLVGFGLRTFAAYPQVFSKGQTKFLVGDGWYHLRLVENLSRNFPTWNQFDPYLRYPDGQFVPVAPLTPWLLAGLSRILGGGEPSRALIEQVCAWFSPIVAGILLVPVYLLGRRLKNRVAGLLATALVATSSGLLLHRSLLGYLDHHIPEAFLAVCFVLTASIAYRSMTAGEPTVENSGPLPRGPVFGVLWSIAAGLLLGLYLLNWLGGVLLVAIAVVWVTAQVLIEHLHRRDARRLCVLGLLLLAPAGGLLTFWQTPLLGRQLSMAGIVGGSVWLILLLGMVSVARRTRRPRRTLFAMIGAVAALAAGSAVTARPALVTSALAEITRLGAGTAPGAIPETRPLLFANSAWTLATAWSEFGATFFLAIPALALLAIRAVRRADGAALLVTLWSGAMLAATLVQVRFAYHYAVCAALLTAYLVASLLSRWFARGRTQKNERASSATASFSRGRALSAAAVGIALFALLFQPNLSRALRAGEQVYTPPDEWIVAMHWLRENTPEPFGAAEMYYARYDAPRHGEAYPYPPSAYGVLSSWSYGYWIIREGRRIPTANPGQHGARDAARWFLSQSVEEAEEIMQRVGARYVVLDSTLPFMESEPGGAAVGRVSSLAFWAEAKPEKFFEEWRMRNGQGTWQRFIVYYPDYYRTLLARLFIFRGRAAKPSECYVLSYRESRDTRGSTFKELLAARKFENYAAAQQFAAQQPPATTRLVGTDPYESCVPLEELGDSYRLVHQSATKRCELYGEQVGNVEIYAFEPSANPGDDRP